MAVKRKILIADDDTDILEVTKIILELYGGYQVDTIDRGEELLDLKEPLPDLILLDVWMSGNNGQDICRHLKAEDHTKTIPVVMFSANRELKRIADECGADDYLSKPYQMEDLLEKVGGWM